MGVGMGEFNEETGGKEGSLSTMVKETESVELEIGLNIENTG